MKMTTNGMGIRPIQRRLAERKVHFLQRTQPKSKPAVLQVTESFEQDHFEVPIIAESELLEKLPDWRGLSALRDLVGAA